MNVPDWKTIIPFSFSVPRLDKEKSLGKEEGSPMKAVAASAAGLVLAVVVFAIAFRYFKKRSALLDEGWKQVVKFNELLLMKKPDVSKANTANMSSDPWVSPDLVLPGHFGVSAIRAARKHRKSVSQHGDNVVDAGTKLEVGRLMHARYRGRDVFVTLLSQSSCSINSATAAELCQMSEVHHVNVNDFLGVTVEPYRISIIQEYCSKGTLASVLGRRKLQLDYTFKFSFASDIVDGMTYLHHSPIGSHGRLTSSNILVDSRWLCKIANIPLPNFERNGAGYALSAQRSTTHSRAGHVGTYDAKATRQGSRPEDSFWTASELLREKEYSARGTRPGDIYSFGVVLSEIITRQPPFNSCNLSEAAIFSRIKSSMYPAFRPSLATDDSSLDHLVEIARLCWDEVSAFRPSFVEVKRMLKKFKQDTGGKNLVDEMIAKMESYTVNLEMTVSERTGELEQEKARAEEVLRKMLPRSIIEELKQGHMVAPETYESVTVYFSAVVGFTKLAAESKALEVVDFLNDLYCEFDNIIDSYNAYKVETISDAYMVASGLPIRHPGHAAEIATMALDILSVATTFRIRHRPESQLQLRIGFHSGPVVAGIVGLQMPRYCLFGDTVNYASRMESSGLALRIQVSPESKELLAEAGGFHLEKRGFVTMKGKGSIETYHLTGKDGFDKPLPDIGLAASKEEHEFK